MRCHGGGSNPNQDDMVQPELVEAVLEGQNALDLVGLDHRVQNIADGQGSLGGSVGAAVQVVAKGEDSAQVVRRMSPFAGQPGVVVVQPANQRAQNEGGLNRV